MQLRDARHDGQAQAVTGLPGTQYPEEPFPKPRPLPSRNTGAIIPHSQARTALWQSQGLDAHPASFAAIAHGIVKKIA